jgi:hypothetical protein
MDAWSRGGHQNMVGCRSLSPEEDTLSTDATSGWFTCLLSAHRREHAAAAVRSVVALGAPCDGFGAYYGTRAWAFGQGERAAPLVAAASGYLIVDKQVNNNVTGSAAREMVYGLYFVGSQKKRLYFVEWPACMAGSHCCNQNEHSITYFRHGVINKAVKTRCRSIRGKVSTP